MERLELKKLLHLMDGITPGKIHLFIFYISTFSFRDSGYMNPDGSLVISGRSKDMIIRGGENIYPTEIEQFLFKMPGIADVQVIGVPDERYGEEICAWIRLRDGITLTAEDVISYCKSKISHNKVPKYVLFKKEHDFPLTATGKVQKFELRNISRRELGLEQVKSHFNS